MSIRDLSNLTARALDGAAFLTQRMAPVVTRLVLGEAFFFTGLGKWRNFGNTVDFFASLGLPLPAANAAMVATIEMLGGICLILGLGTRLSAALLSSTMVVALATADRGSLFAALPPGGASGLTEVVPFAFLLFLLWIVAAGSGPLSVDRVLARRRAAA